MLNAIQERWKPRTEPNERPLVPPMCFAIKRIGGGDVEIYSFSV